MGRNVVEVIIKAKDQASKQLGQFSGVLGDIAPIVAGAVAAFAGFKVAERILKSSIAVANEFNKELANVSTLMTSGSARIYNYREAIQDLSREVVKSTTDLTQGYYQVVSAFGEIKDSLKILTISAKAAKAGVSSTESALKLLSAAMKGYGDVTAEAATYTADLAFMTVKLGQTIFDDLAQSMGRAIPLAAELGVEQKELFAIYATLTGVTGDAAMVTTQLSGIMNGLMSRTEEADRALKRLGYTSIEAAVAEMGLVGTVQALVGATDRSQESIKELFENIRALPAVLALTGKQAETFKGKLDALGRSARSMETAFLAQRDGINAAGEAIEGFQNTITDIQQDIGENLAGMVEIFAEDISSIIRSAWEAIDILGKTRRQMMAWGGDEAGGLGENFSFVQLRELAEAAREGRDEYENLRQVFIKQNKKVDELAEWERKISETLAKIAAGKIQGIPATGDIIILKDFVGPPKPAFLDVPQGGFAQPQARLPDAYTSALIEFWTNPLPSPEYVDAGEGIVNMLENVENTASSVAGGMASSFHSAFMSMIQGGREVGDIMKQVLFQILSMFFKVGVGKAFGSFISFNKGGEWIPHARSGLEVIGGQIGRDTVPAMVSRGEVVMPSPTVDRLNRALDAGMGGGTVVQLNPLMMTGSRHEAYRAAGFIEEKLDMHKGYVIEGVI